MEILAHRGLWPKGSDKKKSKHSLWRSMLFRHGSGTNSPTAFRRAWAQKIGVETDIRDRNGKLVISHTPARLGALGLRDFLKLYNHRGDNTPLALNIRADGLVPILKPLLAEQHIENYFVFDMPVSEMMEYAAQGLRFFTRQSELEREPALYEDAAGIWMDSFFEDWITPGHILKHIHAGKQICFVSPERHGRTPEGLWHMLKDSSLHKHPGLFLCTDQVHEALTFFA